MIYLFAFILFIGCEPSDKQDPDESQSDNQTQTDTAEDSTPNTADTNDTADLVDDESEEDRFDFPVSNFESSSMTYDGQVQVPELTLSLDGSVLSVAHGIFNAYSGHDFLGEMSVLLEDSIIVVNYGLIDVPFGDNVPTWYDLSYDLDLSSLESGTHRFRIVLDYDFLGEQDTSVFLEQDIILE